MSISIKIWNEPLRTQMPILDEHFLNPDFNHRHGIAKTYLKIKINYTLLIIDFTQTLK
jgi:hypothetical protein